METQDIKIRYGWHPETCRWNYSVVDVIDCVITTTDARNYWKVLKNRLKKRGSGIATACNQLKLQSRDGKYYLTDTANAETIREIVQTISTSPFPELEVWIASIESKKTEQNHPTSEITMKSFPQEEVGIPKKEAKETFRNRLKKFFHMNW